MHEGHRKRMLERLKDVDSLQNHELIEMLLYNAIPRKNTNGIAHNLLKTFGSINGIYKADFDQLKNVDGVGSETAAYLRCIAIFYDRLRFDEEAFPESFNTESYSAFLTERFKGLTNEVVEVFALNAKERVKSCKRFVSPYPNQAAVSIEELNAFIGANRPHGLIVAHNHPSASCKPSPEDDNFTRRIAMLCSVLDVKFYDHGIVGKDGFYSYYRNARLEQFKYDCNLGKHLNGK